MRKKGGAPPAREHACWPRTRLTPAVPSPRCVRSCCSTTCRFRCNPCSVHPFFCMFPGPGDVCGRAPRDHVASHPALPCPSRCAARGDSGSRAVPWLTETHTHHRMCNHPPSLPGPPLAARAAHGPPPMSRSGEHTVPAAYPTFPLRLTAGARFRGADADVHQCRMSRKTDDPRAGAGRDTGTGGCDHPCAPVRCSTPNSEAVHAAALLRLALVVPGGRAWRVGREQATVGTTPRHQHPQNPDGTHSLDHKLGGVQETLGAVLQAARLTTAQVVACRVGLGCAGKTSGKTHPDTAPAQRVQTAHNSTARTIPSHPQLQSSDAQTWLNRGAPEKAFVSIPTTELELCTVPFRQPHLPSTPGELMHLSQHSSVNRDMVCCSWAW